MPLAAWCVVGVDLQRREDAGLLGRAWGPWCGRDGGALDGVARRERLVGVHVDAGRFESVLDDAHQRVGEYEDLHVAAQTGLAGLVDGPELVRVRKACSPRH